MESAVMRWIVLAAGVVASGAATWSVIGFLISPRGVPGPGVVDATSPVMAAVMLLVAMALATAVAVVVGRLLNPVVGLFTLGSALCVLSMRMGTIRDASFDGTSLVPLAIESLFWALLVAGASLLVHRVARDDDPAHGAAHAGHGSSGALASMAEAFSPASLKVAAIGAVAIIGAWLLVTSPLKGQAIGAALVGGVLAGHVARRSAPEASPVLLFASPVAIIAVAQLILAMTVADAGSAFVRGAIPNLVAIMPLDLAGGSIVGVAIGIGLAKPSS
ncbi:MAG: hypothetical protein KF724_13515 [Phycisphaeraceae bacterium]|nr:hypothetical protein [Phycisphaeraceae bacterium]